MPKLILASSSPRRLDLLTKAGLKPDLVENANILEVPKNQELPKDFVLRMALEKANYVAANHKGANIIIAGDTIVAVGRRILGKAANRDEAKQQWQLMSGRRHRVYSGIAILKMVDGVITQTANKAVFTHVQYKRMQDWEIEQYLDTNEWQGKSGSYALQGMAGAFIKQITGSYTNVIGLPLMEVRNIVLGMGFTNN